MILAALPTNLSDPGERLGAMHEAIRAAKDQHGAISAGPLADVSQFAMPALANQAWRLSAKLRLFERVSPFNLFVSNVPGPNVPLYFAGAELLAYYLVSALGDGQGLNIAVMSYREPVLRTDRLPSAGAGPQRAADISANGTAPKASNVSSLK